MMYLNPEKTQGLVLYSSETQRGIGVGVQGCWSLIDGRPIWRCMSYRWDHSLIVDRAGQTRAPGFFLHFDPKAIPNPFLTPPRTLPDVSEKGGVCCRGFGQTIVPVIGRNLSTPQTRGPVNAMLPPVNSIESSYFCRWFESVVRACGVRSACMMLMPQGRKTHARCATVGRFRLGGIVLLVRYR
jgi:hypothetical protein